MSRQFDFEQLVELCQRTHEETRRSAVRAVDRSLVVRNWLFGWYIVEYEQSGADRAEYGAQTLKNLSAALKERIGRGFSVRSLEQFRRFFLQSDETMPQTGKSQTLSAISAAAHIPQTPSAKSAASREGLSQVLQSASTALLPRLPLGWSHYVTPAVRNRPRRPPLLRDRGRRQRLERPRTQTPARQLPVRTARAQSRQARRPPFGP